MKTKAFEVKRRNSRDAGHHTVFVDHNNKKDIQGIKEVKSVTHHPTMTPEDCPMKLEPYGTEFLLTYK